MGLSINEILKSIKVSAIVEGRAQKMEPQLRSFERPKEADYCMGPQWRYCNYTMTKSTTGIAVELAAGIIFDLQQSGCE